MYINIYGKDGMEWSASVFESQVEKQGNKTLVHFETQTYILTDKTWTVIRNYDGKQVGKRENISRWELSPTHI